MCVNVLQGITADLRLALRRLIATPTFTLFAVLSLGTGVGVTTAVYSTVNGLFWPETIIRDASRVAVLVGAETGNDVRRVVSVPDADDLRGRQTAFSRISASEIVTAAVALEPSTQLMSVEAVDGGYFQMLGVTPVRGRAIEQADIDSTASVAVISETMWRRRFNAARDVLGRTVRLSGRRFEIIGVTPDGFGGVMPPMRETHLWVPITTGEWFTPRRPSALPERDRRRLTLLGRLKDGVDLDAATREVASLGDALDKSHPRHRRSTSGVPARRGWSLETADRLHSDTDIMWRMGLLVFGLVAMVLVVACTNLSNLVLARGTMRHQEIAVRTALGASRWRLVREQLAESLILAALGGAASYGVLRVVMWWLSGELPLAGTARLVSLQPQIDATVLGVGAVSLLAALAVFGLEPAFQVTRRRSVAVELTTGGGTVGVPKARRQRTLIRWQVAISAGFFIIASMCVRYIAAEAQHDPGVELDGMGVAVVNFYAQGWDEARATRAIDQIVRHGAESPQVDAIAVSTGLPFGTTITPRTFLSPTDKPIIDRGEYAGAEGVAATPAYFQATGTRILRGRAFDHRDSRDAPGVIILGESAARRIFGRVDVVGRSLLVKVDSQRLRSEDPVRTVSIVGIAEDVDTGRFFSRRSDAVYMPLAQEYRPVLTVVARAASDSTAVHAVRQAVRTADPDLAIERIGTGDEMLAGPYVFLRGAGIVAVSLGALTLLLAMAGLYGVQSHIVLHRTREIGVRLSLGATAAQVKRLILKEGYRPVFEGLAIGVFIGLVGRAIVRSFLSAPISIFDPWMLILVPAPLIFAAFFACYLPAVRASRVEPYVALRHL